MVFPNIIFIILIILQTLKDVFGLFRIIVFIKFIQINTFLPFDESIQRERYYIIRYYLF